MFKPLLTKVFGTRHQREAKRVRPIVDEINRLYAEMQALPEFEFRQQTEKLRAIVRERTGELEGRIAELKERKRVTADAGEREVIDNELEGPDGRGGLEGELRQVIADTLDEILPEAFATVREACRRLVGTIVTVTGRELAWDMVPYDVQLHGGIELHEGKIAEMATGEGKTLVATLPLYLNALANLRRRDVHAPGGDERHGVDRTLLRRVRREASQHDDLGQRRDPLRLPPLRELRDEVLPDQEESPGLGVAPGEVGQRVHGIR